MDFGWETRAKKAEGIGDWADYIATILVTDYSFPEESLPVHFGRAFENFALVERLLF